MRRNTRPHKRDTQKGRFRSIDTIEPIFSSQGLPWSSKQTNSSESRWSAMHETRGDGRRSRLVERLPVAVCKDGPETFLVPGPCDFVPRSEPVGFEKVEKQGDGRFGPLFHPIVRKVHLVQRPLAHALPLDGKGCRVSESFPLVSNIPTKNGDHLLDQIASGVMKMSSFRRWKFI